TCLRRTWGASSRRPSHAIGLRSLSSCWKNKISAIALATFFDVGHPAAQKLKRQKHSLSKRRSGRSAACGTESVIGELERHLGSAEAGQSSCRGRRNSP